MGTGLTDGIEGSAPRNFTAGLLDVARTNLGVSPQITDAPTNADVAKWTSALEVRFDPWHASWLEDPCDPDLQAPTSFPETLTVEAWSIRTAIECVYGAGSSVLERTKEATKRLAAEQWRWLTERELWTGTIAQASLWDNPYLADVPVPNQINGGVALPVSQAYAELVQAASDASNGTRLLIHVARRTLIQLARAGIATRAPQQSIIEDPAGNYIVAGAGYTGGSPSGVIDATGGTSWMVATAMVDVRSTEPKVTPEDRSVGLARVPDENTVDAWGARKVLALFDPAVHVGVNADLCETCCEHVVY